MLSVYEAAGGYEGLVRLATAWHHRVMDDEVVSHAFSHGFKPDHLERLAAYWSEALGGPASYTDAYGGETDVVTMHSGNGPHEEMAARDARQTRTLRVDLALRSEFIVDDSEPETSPSSYLTRPARGADREG